MEFCANEGKNLAIDVNGKKYLRHAIKTRFINRGENYIDIIEEYIKPIYADGDIVSISEKIIAMCQNRVVHRDELRISGLAKFLSKFATRTSAGVGVGDVLKMQYAINTVGASKVLWASVAAAAMKMLGKKGVFYEIVGREVSGLDGFNADAWDEYADIGILIPENPCGVCNEIKDKLGINCMIVDANDLGQEILGWSNGIDLSEQDLRALIRDNPAGQGKQRTPLILIRQECMA